MSKQTETTKKEIVTCSDCGNQHGSQAVHLCRMKRVIFVDQVTTDYTIVKITGPDHEACGDKIVRYFND